MKTKKIVFGIIGGLLIGLMVVGFVLHAVLQIKSGKHWAYHNYKYQWMTYLGALATLGIMAVVCLIGLYYRARRFLEKKRSARQ